jgi:Porin subfamily/DcaP outer membrane protein
MMKNGRNGILAVLGVLIAAVALLSGLPAAKADELADLRANQQLLQQRLDQLAQVPAVGSPVGGLYGGGPAGPVGVPSLGGSFPRSFLIPGTDTSIRIGGTITVNAMYFFNGGNPNTTTASTTNFGNNGALNTAPLHVHNGAAVAGVFPKAGNPARSKGADITFISPQQSKVGFETRTPTAWGEARTFMEFDWSNGNQFIPGNNALLSTNNLIPRLRFAYATLGGLLGGQANSNFSDPDGEAESINFGGLTGNSGVTRIPQIRYTQPLAAWGVPGAISMSAEAPETDGVTSGGGLFSSDATSQAPSQTCLTTVANAAGLTPTCTTTLAAVANPFKAPAPDLTWAWYIPQSWGHADFAAVYRPTLEMKDGAFVNRTFSGYGLHFSGDVKPRWFGWDKDYIIWNFSYGDGLGRYMAGNSTEFSIISNYPVAAPATAALARDVFARTTISWGGQVAYQHWWTPTLRSNAGFGILHHDIPNIGNTAAGFVCQGQAAQLAGTGNCGLNKELIATEVNLIWNPVPFADIGVEYFWGHRQVLSNLKGDVNGLISRFRVNF